MINAAGNSREQHAFYTELKMVRAKNYVRSYKSNYSSIPPGRNFFKPGKNKTVKNQLFIKTAYDERKE